MKLAIFVEGLTEAEFVRSFLSDFVRKNAIKFTLEFFESGLFYIKYSSKSSGHVHEVLIANCGNDGKVVSALRERYAALVDAGYEAIIGLRDLYPLSHTELQKLKAGISSALPQGTKPVSILIAVAEIEAWFIEEELHFYHIDHRLTQSAILASVGYDIHSGKAELIQHPANDLNAIYNLVQKAYKKKGNQIRRTVRALDMTNLYINARHRSISLDEFISTIEGFLV